MPPGMGKISAFSANFVQKKDFSAEKRPKRDNFSQKVSLRDQSLLKETKLGALH